MTRPPDDDARGADSRWPLLGVAAVLLLVAVGGAIDLATDEPASWLSTHVIFELAVMATSLGCAAWLWRGWRDAARSADDVRRELLASERAMRVERDQWRASAQAALDGLGRAMDRQFDAWNLTPAEREVALLLLKGHGHKQAAALTGRSERTVRQHAVQVYQKAGLRGRAELAAFFLEDLLLPRPEDAPRAAPTTEFPDSSSARPPTPPGRAVAHATDGGSA